MDTLDLVDIQRTRYPNVNKFSYRSKTLGVKSRIDFFLISPGGVLLGILGGGVPPGSSNPDPISDLNMPFSTPVFRPDL